jgi:cytidylate kinase
VNAVAVPVIAIDGPSASGKGTVAQRVAAALGFTYLDSGAIYRAAALAALRAGVDLHGAHEPIAAIAGVMPLRFGDAKVWLGAADVTSDIRSEECGVNASHIAAQPAVRAALLARQRAFRTVPGLVADGRDMASVVFPDAALKVFLTASVDERAWRRLAQLRDISLGEAKHLIENEKDAKLRILFDSVLADLQERDRRDAGRAAAPLKQVEGAKLLDTTQLSVDQAVARILGWYREIAAR